MDEGRYLIFKAKDKKQAEKFGKQTDIEEQFKWDRFSAKENCFYFCINFLSKKEIEKLSERLQEQIIEPHNISGEIIIQKQKHHLQNQ